MQSSFNALHLFLLFLFFVKKYILTYTNLTYTNLCIQFVYRLYTDCIQIGSKWVPNGFQVTGAVQVTRGWFSCFIFPFWEKYRNFNTIFFTLYSLSLTEIIKIYIIYVSVLVELSNTTEPSLCVWYCNFW